MAGKPRTSKNHRYYDQHRQAILDRKRAHYAANRERKLAAQKQYRDEHRPAINLSRRLHIPTPRARAMLGEQRV